jgi:predicted DNA binding CopG/RHH family protein
MAKKVSIGTKPAATPSLDTWVASRGEEQSAIVAPQPVIKMKRLTIDISESLHRAIKSKAVAEGVPMADMLREILEKHFG